MRDDEEEDALKRTSRPTKEGVEAKVAEFPDIKVSAWGIDGALVRLRQAVWQRMRWTKGESNCAGEPISPTKVFEP